MTFNNVTKDVDFYTTSRFDIHNHLLSNYDWKDTTPSKSQTGTGDSVVQERVINVVGNIGDIRIGFNTRSLPCVNTLQGIT